MRPRQGEKALGSPFPRHVYHECPPETMYVLSNPLKVANSRRLEVESEQVPARSLHFSGDTLRFQNVSFYDGGVAFSLFC